MVSYNTLKKGLESGEPDAFQTFIDFFEDLLYMGTMDGNFPEFQKCCIAAKSMPIYYSEDINTMQVVSEGNSLCLYVNPVNIVAHTKNREQILFIFAHEMKHILLGHLVKYVELLKVDVLQVIINLAGDYEVNESLISELRRSNRSLSCVPRDCIYSKTILPFTDCTEYTLKRRVNSMVGTPADAIYHLIEEKVTRVLGYNFSDMLYYCGINRTTFVDEIQTVAYGGKSKIFKVSDTSEAQDLCRRLNNYLQDRLITILAFSEDSLYTSRDGEDLLDKIKGTFNIIAGGTLASTSDRELSKKISNIQVPPEVNWVGVLRNRSRVVSQDIRYSKKRVNRRQPYRLDLSGKLKKYKLNIVVAIDESGSISDKEYLYFMSELRSILLSVECSLSVIRFTEGVRERFYVKTKVDFDNLFSVDNYVRYFGGTSFQPIFDELNNDKNLDLNSTILIIFTDGQAEGSVDFGNVKNRLWVLTHGHSLSCRDYNSNIFPVHR